MRALRLAGNDNVAVLRLENRVTVIVVFRPPVEHRGVPDRQAVGSDLVKKHLVVAGRRERLADNPVIAVRGRADGKRLIVGGKVVQDGRSRWGTARRVGDLDIYIGVTRVAVETRTDDEEIPVGDFGNRPALFEIGAEQIVDPFDLPG